MSNPCNENELPSSGVCSFKLESHAEFWQKLNLVESLSLLCQEEFCEVLKEKREDLVICGLVDLEKQRLTLWRGSYKPIIVPLAIFTPSGDGTIPDFSRLSIIDYGQTVRFGEYEAATDYILSKDTDIDYRKFKPPGPSSYEPKVPKPMPSPLKGLREKGSSSYDASGRRDVG